jgi:hypothetical protein
MSSSVYPAIISGIENRELAVIADALANMDNVNKEMVDTSGYHSSILPSTAPSQSQTPVSEPQLINSIPLPAQLEMKINSYYRGIMGRMQQHFRQQTTSK